MPTNIFFNSKTQIASEDNFLYDFGVSRDLSPANNSLNTNQNQQAPGPGSLPRFKLKGDTTGTPVQNTQFAYQFSGHGDKSENLNPSDLFSSGSDFGFPTRTYSSQILTQIEASPQTIAAVPPTDDIQSGNILPIFIFGSNTPPATAPNPAIFSNGPVNAFTFRKVKIIVELFNLNQGAQYATITQNLFNFRVFNMPAAQGNAPGLANFPQTLGILPTKTNTANVANYVANMPNPPAAADQFTTQETAIGITPTSIGNTPAPNVKFVINYELDLDKTISLQAGQYVMLALKFNGSGAAGGTAPNLTAGQAAFFNGVNLKITSHVTIHDNTKSPSRDNL